MYPLGFFVFGASLDKHVAFFFLGLIVVDCDRVLSFSHPRDPPKTLMYVCQYNNIIGRLLPLVHGRYSIMRKKLCYLF